MRDPSVIRSYAELQPRLRAVPALDRPGDEAWIVAHRKMVSAWKYKLGRMRYSSLPFRLESEWIVPAPEDRQEGYALFNAGEHRISLAVQRLTARGVRKVMVKAPDLRSSH